MSPSPSSSSSPSPSRRRVLAALGAVGVDSVGVAGYAGTVTVPHLSPVWERWRTGTSESGAVGVAAAAAGGRLFLTRGDRLAALDPATGDHLWTHPAGAGNQPVPSPVVRDGAVCVVGDEATFALTEREW